MNKLLLFTTVAMAGASLFAIPVTDVTVKALDSFGGDTSAVLSRCQTKPGTEYDASVVSRDVNSLNASGEYQEISVDAERSDEGVAVTFYVRRKMRYQGPIAVQGNKFFSESKISKEAALKDGTLYSDGDFATAAAAVRTAYQKKYFPYAKVSVIAEPIPGANNNCTVTFVVDEGPRQKIGRYDFDGVESVDPAELRAAIDDYPWWHYKSWFLDSPITPEAMEACREKIATVFRDKGYLDVTVSEARMEPMEPGQGEKNDGKVAATFDIHEGPLYKIGSTKIAGLTRYPEATVAGKSDLPVPGDIAGEKALNDAAHRISVTVGSGDSGLADTRVDVRRIPSAADPTVLDIVFNVTEGVPVVINEVRIEGNDYTKDRVIRREIALGPGDRMLADRAERSQHRLENLDYFSRVRYYLKETGRGKDATGAEYRDLVYEVEEKNTGSFMVGLGASSVDHVYVSAELAQSNFDLFAPEKMFRGAGQKGRIFAQAGPRIQTYEASVTEPHLFDRLLELTVEAYRRQRWYDEYDIIRTGGAATLAYPVKFWPTWEPFGRFGVRWTLEYIEFHDIDRGDMLYRGKTVSLDHEDREYGDAVESVFRFFWSHDTRDNFRIPTDGSRTSVYLDLAGGDNEYWRLGFSHRNYWKVVKKYDHILMLALRAETIDGFSDDVPIYNRLFLGGPKSIRGIEYRHVSPFARRYRGGSADNDLSKHYVPWGGQTLVCANLEYTIPVFKMLRMAAFTDAGSVSEDEMDISDDFAWTVGFGIRLDIPMFPVRLDFATPIEKPSEADKEVFSFSVGYDF